MSGNLKITLYLLALSCVVCFATSCRISYDLEECDHNLRITYHYNRENLAESNCLDEVIFSLDQYIYDEQGVLYKSGRLTPDPCTGEFVSELTLPAGRYSLVTWGNRSDDNKVNEALEGTTRRERMELNPECPYEECADPATALQRNGDRLYHCYRTFTVAPVGISRIRADMVHSHLVLKFRVRWKNEPPANNGDFHSLMKDIPSRYGFMPEFVFPSGVCKTHDPSQDDKYRQVCQNCIHHIPTVQQVCTALTHRIDTRMSGSMVEGEFVSYRIRNETDVVMSLHTTDPQTQQIKQVMKDVNLRKFFQDNRIELDRNLKQEFRLEFVIDGNQVTVSALEVGDWNEGGPLDAS